MSNIFYFLFPDIKKIKQELIGDCKNQMDKLKTIDSLQDEILQLQLILEEELKYKQRWKSLAKKII